MNMELGEWIDTYSEKFAVLFDKEGMRSLEELKKSLQEPLH